MTEHPFSTRQALSLATMFLIGQVLILYNGYPARGDAWLSLLMAYVATIPFSLMCARLINVFPGKNMFDLQIYVFGPVVGRIFVLLYTLFCLHIGSLVLRDMTEFIQESSLTDTPQIVSALMIGILCVYTVKAGINTISRYTAISLPVFLAILFVVALLTATLWTSMSHVGPILYGGFKPVIRSAANVAILPFSDAALLPFVLQPLKEHRKAKLIFLVSYAISTVLFLAITLQVLLVLGNNAQFSLYSPVYVMVSLIEIGDFLQRIEVAVGAILFMGAFVKISIYLYVFSLGISKLFSLEDYRKFAAPAGMLIISFSLFAYPNVLTNLAFATSIYPYYGFLMNVLLIVVIWAAAEWKRKKLKNAGKLPDPPPAMPETPIERQVGGQTQPT